MKQKTLVIYYSLSNETRKIAKLVQTMVKADLYEIKTERTYNADMWKAWDEAQEETRNGILPKLVGAIPDISQYDTIIVGGPVWGYTLANPVTAFMKSANVSGKKVSAFWTFYDHDEKYNLDMKTESKGAEYHDGLSLPRTITCNQAKLEKELKQWLQTLLKINE